MPRYLDTFLPLASTHLFVEAAFVGLKLGFALALRISQIHLILSFYGLDFWEYSGISIRALQQTHNAQS